jgi:hypothetical protein
MMNELYPALYNEELCDLFSSPDINYLGDKIKEDEMGWARGMHWGEE